MNFAPPEEDTWIPRGPAAAVLLRGRPTNDWYDSICATSLVHVCDALVPVVAVNNVVQPHTERLSMSKTNQGIHHLKLRKFSFPTPAVSGVYVAMASPMFRTWRCMAVTYYTCYGTALPSTFLRSLAFDRTSQFAFGGSDELAPPPDNVLAHGDLFFSGRASLFHGRTSSSESVKRRINRGMRMATGSQLPKEAHSNK